MGLGVQEFAVHRVGFGCYYAVSRLGFGGGGVRSVYKDYTGRHRQLSRLLLQACLPIFWNTVQT